MLGFYSFRVEVCILDSCSSFRNCHRRKFLETKTMKIDRVRKDNRLHSDEQEKEVLMIGLFYYFISLFSGNYRQFRK